MTKDNLPNHAIKHGQPSLFDKWWALEFTAKNVHRIPKWLETHHLTLSTVLWSLLVLLFSFLAKDNINWLWGVSTVIVLQYLSDCFDGAVGRLRGTGLVKWGYYMDHFLDYIFLCSILIGYSFIFQDRFNTLFFILAVIGGHMVSSYLKFGATQRMQIAHFRFGPTEARFLIIVLNTLIIVFHKSVPLAHFLPYVLLAALIGLIIIVYRTHKELWAEDMEIKSHTETVRDDTSN